MEDFSQYSNDELQKIIDSGGTWQREELLHAAAQGAEDFSQYTDEELRNIIDSGGTWRPAAQETAQAAQETAQPSQPLTRDERIAQSQRAIERAQQPGEGETDFWGAVGESLAEGARGAGRAIKSAGQGVLGTATSAVRLAGTPIRAVTGWDGIHKLADKIDESYANFGRDALMSEYGENPDGWGYALGRAGEKVAGVAGSLAGLGAAGKAVQVAGGAAKMAGLARTAKVAENALPLMFGNDAAVRAYDTARLNGKSKAEAAALAGLNGAIHFFGFKAFENQSLKKMLNIGPEVEVMMPKWANALADGGGQSFSSLVRGTRNGMIKYIAAENGKRALKAGGIMGLQDMLSDPVMQVAEGANIDNIDFSRMLKAGAHGVGEGALMEGLTGGAAIYKSQKAAKKFIADKYFRGKDYKVMGADGKIHDEPGLLDSAQGRMTLMKQNPDATERVLDIVEHGGKPTEAELDAAFLPPDMTAEELKKFASDWRKDLEPYVDEAWAADAPRQASAPDASVAGPSRDILTEEEAARARQQTEPETTQEQENETRTNEAPAQPASEQPTSAGQAESEAAKPVESAAPPREATDAGVVTSPVSTSEKISPVATEKPAEAAKPVKEAPKTDASLTTHAKPAVWPRGWENEGEKIEGYVAPQADDIRPRREVAIAHRSGGSINAPQKIKGVVESVDGDKVKVYYRDGMGYDQHDTFDKREIVGVMPLSQPAEKPPAAAPKPTEAQTPAEPAKPMETASRASDAEPAVSVPDKANDAQKAALAKLGEGKGVAVTSAEMGKGGVLRVRYTMPSADGKVVEFDSTIDAEGKATTSVAGVKAAPAPAVQTGEATLPEAPAPATQTQTNIPNEKKSSPAPAPSNRLRRADGTDPLAEREQAAAQSPAAPAPVSRTIRGNLVEKRLRPIIDLVRNEDGSFNPDALRNHDGNNGLPLKDLKLLNEHPEIVDDLGLPAEDAAALKSALKEAYNTQRVATPNSKEGKVSEAGQFNYSVSASKALERLAKYPNNLKSLVLAQQQVSAAYTAAKDSGDTQGAKFWEGRLTALNEQIGKLPANEQAKIQGILDSINGTKSAMERKNTQSLESGEGKTLDVADGGAADAEAPAAPAPKGGATGQGGSLGGNRHLIIDSVNGDNLTVTMKDAAGKVLVKGQKMTRAQWAALANGADAVDGDPAAPQKGDLIRRAKSDAADLPDAWTPETQKPLERIAHALRNVVTTGGKRIKVEFLNERPESDVPNVFKNAEGETVGEYDAAKGEIRLYPGATVADVVHEFTHPLVDFARAEARAGRGEFLGKIKEIIDAERATWEKSVRDAYKGKGEEDILEEIFTHAMGKKGAKLFGKSTNTLQGRRWYNQLWQAIKRLWQDFATKMGWNKADLRGLERMSPEDAARKILSEMAKGRSFGDAKTLGRLEAMGEGTRNAFAGTKGAERLGIGKRSDAEQMEKDGASREDIWRKTGWWRGNDGKWRVEIPDLMSLTDAYVALRKKDPKYADELLNRESRGKVVFVNNLFQDDPTWQSLVKAYPRIKGLAYAVDKSKKVLGESFGAYSHLLNLILLSSEGQYDPRTFVHELQHAIQRNEGFASGGSIQDAKNYIARKHPALIAARDEIQRIGKDSGFESWVASLSSDDMGAFRDEYKRHTNLPLFMYYAQRVLPLTADGRRMYDTTIKAIRKLDAETIRAEADDQSKNLSPYNIYRSFAGEVESRNVEKRLYMTPEWRAAHPPWETEDVPEGEQIVRYDGGIASSVRESRSVRPGNPAKPTTDLIDEKRTKGEKLREGAQDADIAIRNVQDELGGIVDKQTASGHTDAKTTFKKDGTVDKLGSTDVYSAKMRANGHLQAGFNEIEAGQRRIDKTLADNGITPEEFGKFLYAQHAPERNQTVAARQGVAYDSANKEYSGMSTDEANAYLASPAVAAKRAALDSAAQELYRMQRQNLDRLLESGRISKDFHDLLTTRWQKYVPLRTDVEGKDGAAYNLSVGGFRQNEFMTAEGRKSLADSPYAFAMLQVQQGLRGSEANTINLTAANLVRHAESLGHHIGDIMEGKESGRGKGWTFKFADGDIVQVGGDMKLAKNRSDIILFKENGELKAIRMVKGAEGRGEALADAITGRNVRQWHKDLSFLPKWTRWLSAMRTQYSPEFIFSNALADHMESTQALVGRYGIKDGFKLAGKALAWEKRNNKDLRQYIKTGDPGTGYVKEAIDAGVLIKGGVAAQGYSGELKNIESNYEKFVRDAKGFGKMSAKEKASFVWDGLKDFVSNTNELIENSTRIGIYSALRESGVSKADAVKFAREATVDFNRKGTYTPWINGLYMFSNASVQGALRSVQAMGDEHGGQLVGLLVAAGVTKAVLDHYLGNDDEREKAGGRNARNLTEYDKKHKLGIPVGGGWQFAGIRMRGPYAAIPYLAQTFTNVALGETSTKDAAKTVVRELTDQATDLVGGNGMFKDNGEFDGALLGQSFAPTLADPLVQLYSGKDYKGDERRRKTFDKTTPLSSNGKRNTSSWYKGAAEGLNWLTGGNENRKGFVDVAPEDLQLVVEFLAGGVGRDIHNVVSSVQNAKERLSGGTPERTVSQIPFVRTLFNEYPENTSRYFDAIDDYERDKAEYKKTTDLKRRAELGKEKPYLRPMVVDGKVSAKSAVDTMVDNVKELMHLERGEVKAKSGKWIVPKVERTEAQKEAYRKRRLALQARILKRLGK